MMVVGSSPGTSLTASKHLHPNDTIFTAGAARMMTIPVSNSPIITGDFRSVATSAMTRTVSKIHIESSNRLESSIVHSE